MIRRCTGDDPNLVAEDGKTPCRCGLVFNDVARMVIYPHARVGGGASLEEVRRWQSRSQPSSPRV